MTQAEFEAYKQSSGARVINTTQSAAPLQQQQQFAGVNGNASLFPPSPVAIAQNGAVQQPQLQPQQLQQQIIPVQPIPISGVPAGFGASMEPGVLYGAMLSCNCIGVLTFIRLLNLPVRWEEIDLTKGEQMADWFLQMNPCHCVPTYKSQNGYALWETTSILRFLCNVNPLVAAQWYPSDPYVRGKIDVACDWRQTELYPTASKLGYCRLYGTDFFPFSNKADDAAISKLEGHWKTLRYLLGGFPFIGGNHPCIADCSIVSALKLFDVRDDITVPDDIAAYVSRCERLLAPRQYKEVWSAYDAYAASKKGGKLSDS